mmetsp:Transcript_108817/g.283774  ORF Transcript_108817/g.283774 Transcript_108817/m.283774 type:complete len:90 (+) Transcript_108817:1-270(+)
MLPRACMGIVVRHFLTFNGTGAEFEKGLATRFPCCAQPIEDLKLAFTFWKDLKRCVDAIATPLEAEELMQDMSAATEMLEKQQRIVVLP